MTDVDRLNRQLRAEGRLSLTVKVAPKSGRSEIAGALSDGTLKVRLRASPERGRANAELIELLAREFGVRREQVALVSGGTSPKKHVRIVV